MSDWLPVEGPSSPMTTSPRPIEGDRAVSTRTERLLGESVSTRSSVRTRTGESVGEDVSTRTRSGVRTRTGESVGEDVSTRTRSGVRTRTNAVSTLAPLTVPIDSSPE